MKFKYKSLIPALMILSVTLYGCGVADETEDTDEVKTTENPGTGTNETTQSETSGGTETTSSTEESGTTSESSTVTTFSEAVTSNSLASAYPGTLALSVFPQTINSSSSSLRLTAESPKKISSKAKLEESANILSGTAESCLPASLQADALDEGEISCYEFDGDMIYNTSTTNGNVVTQGTLDGTDSLGEACMVSFARGKMQQAINLVERAKDRFAALLCQAKKDGAADDLPSEGTTIDLKSSLTSILGSKVSSVQEASIKRLSDVSGRAVYKMTISLTDTDSKGVKFTRVMNLVNSPGDVPEVFDGVLWVHTTDDQPAEQHGNLVQTDKDSAFSVVFSGFKDADDNPSISFELRKANIDTNLMSSAFTSGGVLDLNVGRDFTVASTSPDYGKHKKAAGGYYNEANDAIQAITYIAFQVNPQTNAGNISYWQNPGGRYTEPTRGMVFNATHDTTSGKLTGCATSGASSNFSNGMSIGRSLKDSATLAPSSYWHPFLNTSNSSNNWQTPPGGLATDTTGSYYEGIANGPQAGVPVTKKWYVPKLSDTSAATTFVTETSGNFITKQCFTQNAEGLYIIDTSKISDSAGYQIIEGTSTDKPTPPDLSKAKGVSAEIHTATP